MFVYEVLQHPNDFSFQQCGKYIKSLIKEKYYFYIKLKSFFLNRKQKN